MGASKINVNDLGQDVPRTGFMYDVTTRGLDASFWKTLSGTPSVSSNKLRLTSAAITSYTQFKYGTFRFAVNVPTTPSAGEAKKWGLLAPSAATVGAAYFEITGATFRAVSYDESGTAQTTTITWDSWETVETIFEIEWEKDFVIFKVAGTAVATHQTRVGNVPLPLYLINSDADNTDTGYITIKETAQYV